MIVELDRDMSLYPDGNILEVRSSCYFFTLLYIDLGITKWPRTQPATPLDGFTVRRTGDQPTKIRVIMHLEHFPEQYKVAPELGIWIPFFMSYRFRSLSLKVMS